MNVYQWNCAVIIYIIPNILGSIIAVSFYINIILKYYIVELRVVKWYMDDRKCQKQNNLYIHPVQRITTCT